MRLRSRESSPASSRSDPTVAPEALGPGRAAGLFLALARDGSVEAQSQRTIPRSAIALAAALLYVTAAPLYWANVAEGKVRHAPMATITAKVAAEEDTHAAKNDDTPAGAGPGDDKAGAAGTNATSANVCPAAPSNTSNDPAAGPPANTPNDAAAAGAPSNTSNDAAAAGAPSNTSNDAAAAGAPSNTSNDAAAGAPSNTSNAVAGVTTTAAAVCPPDKPAVVPPVNNPQGVVTPAPAPAAPSAAPAPAPAAPAAPAPAPPAAGPAPPAARPGRVRSGPGRPGPGRGRAQDPGLRGQGHAGQEQE